jgi:hypothetical protein
LGFEVGRLSINLHGFASEELRNEQKEDGKWGGYHFRYLRRDAQPSHVDT